MKKLLRLMIICLPILAMSQEKGIHFEVGLTWERVKVKAKAENKYIFVDCFATWCGPCKIMDKEVYTNDTVGSFMNANFISLKVQMDTAKNDNANIKILYATARELESDYKIIGLPTYLFFSPDGQILHKEMGSQTVNEFISLVKDAENPNKQLYTLVNNALSGKLNYNAMPDLVKKLKDNKENDLAMEVAKKYMHGYLDKLSNAELSTKENLFFLHNNYRIISTTDRVFRLYNERADEINLIMSNMTYSEDRLNKIITRIEIEPAIIEADKDGKIPDWKKIKKVIKNKYNKDCALFNVLTAKENWYYNKKDWHNYLATLIRKWKMYRDSFNKYEWTGLNHIAWVACVHSDIKKELRIALQWADLGIHMIEETNPAPVAIIDTKANILYKLGYRKEAIALETQVVEFFKEKLKTNLSEWERKNYPLYIKSYQDIVDKMEKGKHIDLYD